MREGDQVRSDDDLIAELDYCLRRLQGGDRKPWVYVTAGDLASLLGQWPLAIECLRRLDPYEEPARELRDRFRARKERVNLEGPRPELLPAPAELVNQAFLEAAGGAALKRQGAAFFLLATAALSILSYQMDHSWLANALTFPTLSYLWFRFMGEERRIALARGHPVQPVSQRASAVAFVLLLFPTALSLGFGSALPLVLLPFASFGCLSLLSGVRRGRLELPQLTALSLGSLLLSAELMALTFPTWASGGALLLTGAIGLHAIHFLTQAAGRLRARRAYRDDARLRSEQDLRWGFTTSQPIANVAYHDETTRRTIVPALQR